jgi:glucuronate isomerase
LRAIGETGRHQPVRLVLHPDRVLPTQPGRRAIARQILAQTETLPIVSPHGHVDVALLAEDRPFPDPAELFIRPDHYLTRMLGSQGIGRERLGLPADPQVALPDPRATWRLFCQHWRLFRGTPTRHWLLEVWGGLFGLDEHPGEANADRLYDQMAARLAEPDFRPRALLERFGIEWLATTDAAWDSLDQHRRLARAGGPARVRPTFRPDALFALTAPDWRDRLARLEAAVGQDINGQATFVAALRRRRQDFIAAGARASDQAAVSADSTPLTAWEADRVFAAALAGHATSDQAAAFTAHMVFEMARMSCDDGLTMQFHPGAERDYLSQVWRLWGSDVGYDIPVAVDFVRGLRPLLEAFGHDPGFRMVVFTLDETTFSRELAPLAGVFPALKLGAPWWFLDSPAGLRRFRQAVTDTAGFYNTTGFVDDTRAFCSIPARHNLARRIDAGHLAGLVAEHSLELDEAVETAIDLAYNLPNQAYPPPPGGPADD